MMRGAPIPPLGHILCDVAFINPHSIDEMWRHMGPDSAPFCQVDLRGLAGGFVVVYIMVGANFPEMRLTCG